MQNAINWFEIPATDFDRAVAFYSNVLAVDLQKAEFMGEPQAFFPMDRESVGGAIVKSDRLTPSMTGTLIYLNLVTLENLEQALERVEPSGGKVCMGKTDIGDPGFIGLIQDTEGNSIGLHSPRPIA
ncbi:VOC family protein [Pseudanabaena sp. ABRG5-3]|uniref:VOC family protein n=1 Tax=Pseudanabaena sp. ABRG5-3 TaxID=685565 RepID=UPI000DC6F309|nr:VOC family protein [Pseudanabaena sp. ABRG5-3]BBC22972.1 glyoxalase/bleomycin resistance protein [Pseudanabaena sp. ABRG5-3]